MYTVEELIEVLKKCPKDYIIVVNTSRDSSELEIVGIDNEEKTVDLFGEH